MTEIAHRVPRRALRWGFRLVFVAFWIGVLALGTELGLRLLAIRQYADNPSIQAFKEGPALDPPVDAVLGEALRVSPPPRSWGDTAPHPPLAEDWEVPRTMPTREAQHALWAQFPALNEAERARFARVHGLAVCVFDPQGAVQQIYTDRFKRDVVIEWSGRASWFPDPFLDEVLRPLVEEAVASGDALQRELAMESRFPEVKLTAYALPDPDTGACFVFTELERWFVSTRFAATDLGTRYDVVDLSYKKSFDDGHGWVTNRFGFRAPDVLTPKPADVFRVLCIGGSTTAEGNDNASTYPALLERELRTMYPGKKIEVLNFGVQGIRTRSQFLHVATFLELAPDLVIGYLGVNDLRMDVPNDYSAPEDLFYATGSFIERRANWYLSSMHDEKSQWLDDLTMTHIEELRRIFAREGIRFALSSMVVPRREHMTPDQIEYQRYRDPSAPYLWALTEMLNEKIRDYCEAQDLFYIPFDENFRHYEYMTDWCHLTHNGKRLKADIMARCLRDYVAVPINALPTVSFRPEGEI